MFDPSHRYNVYYILLVWLSFISLASASPLPSLSDPACVTTVGAHDPLLKNGQSIIPCPTSSAAITRTTSPTTLTTCLTTIGPNNPLYLSGQSVIPCPPTPTTQVSRASAVTSGADCVTTVGLYDSVYTTGQSGIGCSTSILSSSSSRTVSRSILTTTSTATMMTITTIASAVTTTSTSTYTSTIIPTHIVPQFRVPAPAYRKSSIKLWESLPSRQDLALTPTDQQELGNWKEIAVICDALITSAPWFIPKAVFGVPDPFYKENTVTSVADATTPLARVNDQNPNIALVPLNLFILTEKPLSINVSFDLSQNMEHVVWQRAISAAFLHPEVQNRLQSIRKLYVGPLLKDNDPKGNKFKAMAIFEMLTGLSADLTEKNCPQTGSTPEGDCTPLFEKLGEKEDNMDWSWLYKDFVEMSRDKTLVYPPTVLFSSDGKLRSVTIPNSEDLFIFNLEDPAKPEEDKDAHGNPNEHPLKQVEEMLVWAVRQKDLSVPLNSTTTRETVQKKALTQSAYYQNGPWEPLSTSESWINARDLER